MSPEVLAVILTATNALVLHWIESRDQRHDDDEKNEASELARLREAVRSLEADRDAWREKYYDCRAAAARDDKGRQL